MTRDALTEEPSPGFRAQCCVCGEWSRAALPVRYIPRTSGAPVTLYACPPHAETLVPAAAPGELEQDA
ncbi:hypothetical protein ACWEFL_14680 [Streptomyces sp. NPDC004838]